MNDFALSSTNIKTTTLLVSVSASSWKPQRRVATISCRASNATTKRNFYGVLSISSPESTGAEEIKRAYRAMALRYHPDVCQDPSKKEESTRMFVLLHEAYRILSDPTLRSEYDFELGLGNNNSTVSMIGNVFSRNLWQDQLSVLRKMNGCRTGRKPGSWGSRMREQNRKRED
ncbi:hypothetical protein QQ045_025513 [Rhodiola kirilowii]